MINKIEEIKKMKINNNKSIVEIQKEFASIFPFLKIEFFKNSHNVFEGNSKKEITHKITHLNKPGELTISDTMTVAELEQSFKNQFGLNVQVFRKHGNSWIETTVTDGWTLQKQNEEGRILSELGF